MKNNEKLNQITEYIFENHVKPLCKHPETGEQCEADYSAAKYIVLAVIESDLIKELLSDFWQRTSDACQLEATEAERQEQDFKLFVQEIADTIK